MAEEEESSLLNDNPQSESFIFEKKNESTGIQTAPIQKTSAKTNARFDPISMTSFEASRDPRRVTRSRPNERVKYSNRSQPIFITRRKNKQEAEDRPSDEEIQSYLDSFVNDGEIPPVEYKGYVIQLINRQKVKAILLGQYPTAKYYENILAELNESYKQEALSNTVSMHNDMVNDKRAEYQQQWQELNSKWESRIQQQIQDNESYTSSLQRRQEEEMQAFKERWQAPEFIETFNKPSNLLLNLRYKETKLALTKNYDEAEQIRKMANKQQQEEEQIMKQNMANQMRKEFSQLKERHQRELESAQAHQIKTLQSLESQRKRDLKPYETTDKPAPVSRIMLSTLSRDVSQPCSQMQTPRTASSLITFRQQRHAKLNLPPMDDSDFDRLEDNQPVRPKTAKPKGRVRTKPGSKVNKRLLPVL